MQSPPVSSPPNVLSRLLTFDRSAAGTGVGSNPARAAKGARMRVSAFVRMCPYALLCVPAQQALAAPPAAAPLQKSLDHLVATGVPGAVLLVRDGQHTIRLASGYSVVAGGV